MRVRQDMGETRPAADVIDVVATLAHRPGQVNLRAKAGGEVLGVVTLHPDNAEKGYNFAKRVGVDYSQIERAITTLQAAVQVGSTGNTRPDPDCPDFHVILRGMTQPQAEGRLISGETLLLALRNALDVADYSYAEPVVEWENTAVLAALDVDFHHLTLEQRPSPERLRTLAGYVRPQPALWWPTHGRGLRLVYTALDGLTAAALGACAALGVRSIEPGAGIEIVSHTRHPLYPRPDYPPAGPVQASSPTADLGVLARWLARDVDDHLVAEWLAERGLEQGGRYEHSRCPADADTPSHGQPVFVGYGGICCHKCQAAGVTLGSRRPGFFPWPALVGGGVSTRLRSAARNFVHWDHAKFLLADDLRLEGGLARLCYSAFLKTLHGTADPRVEEAMRRGAGLVRMDGYWVTGDLTRTHRDAGLVDRLAKLPAVCDLVPGEENKPPRIVANRERLGIFQGVDDLGPYGYMRVQPVRGMKIFGQWLDPPDPDAVTAVVPPERLRADEMASCRPRYVPASRRMSVSEAQGILEKSFPGIHFDYLRLVIAARGCAEGGVGQPPRIAVDGPSGAGKDATVAIAAALIGDAWRDVPWVPDIGQFHTALNEAGQSAGLVTSSEIIKHIEAKKGDVLTSLSPLLTFQRGLTVRKYYVGPVPVCQVPVVVITDIAFPREMHADEQLGRRFVHVHLERKVDWQGPARIGIEGWRAAGQGHADAHNAAEFDALVWRAKGLPEPSAWADTLAEARAAGWPGALDKLALRLFGRGKEKDGAELIRRYCRPTKSGDFRPFGPEAAAAMARYNIADVLLLARVHNVVGGHAEPDVLALDGVINARGIAFDADLARDLLRLEEQGALAAGEEVARLTDGAVKSADLRRVKWLKEWLGSRGVEVTDLQKGTLEEVLRARGDLDQAARRVIEARLAAGHVATGKLERAMAMCLPDGRLRDHLAYHGCHTGRWSGRSVQLQNLPRPHDAIRDLPSLLGATHDLAQFKRVLPAGVGVADALSSLVRLCFRAEPGKLLIIADWAAIEARGLAWCAGERRLLDLFAAGRDTYCDFAGGLFGREVTKAMKRERGVGKQAVLACGYGMGADTFAQRCAANRVDLAAAGVTAEQVVEGYRDAYPAITGTSADHGTFNRREGGLWQSVEGAAVAAVGRGVPGRAGQCEFYREQDTLVIRLPGGRQLRYRNARIEDRVPGYCRKRNLPERPKPTLVYDGPDKTDIVTYGAKLVENIVQAVCRDLLVAALLGCERQGLPVVLHVHDEVVVEVPAAGAEDALRRLVAIMSAPPAWAEGFPIEVEGFVSERYLKSPPEGVVVVNARNGQLLEKP